VVFREQPADRSHVYTGEAGPVIGRVGVGVIVERGAVITGTGASPDARVGLADLYAAHRLELVRLAVLLVDDQMTAEDAVQDAFAGLYGRESSLRDPDKALGYLRRSVVNNSRSALRRRRTARGYVPPAEGWSASAEDVAVVADEHRRVLAALHGLSTRQREVLVLRYWGGLSEAEIASTLGVSKGTVKSTASRAIDALGDKLEVQS
jgi:RNA polymerase sigma-70 factor (sigma-E family)